MKRHIGERLKQKGELNEKFPDGIEGHKALLEMEGHNLFLCFLASFSKRWSIKKELYKTRWPFPQECSPE